MMQRDDDGIERTGHAAPRAGPPATLARWFDATVLDLGRQLRWSYVPPLMVYLAAGISGLTAIVGTFFIKDHLGLSATFLAALGFWAGIPWVLKMPLGHLVDLMWRWKSLLVHFGAALIAASIAIMYGLIAHPLAMRAIMAAESWYVLSTLLAPVGYVIQDVVADAMTVEAVPLVDESGRPFPGDEIKRMHTTMQLLGRFAIVGGGLAVALLNIVMFSGVAEKSAETIAAIYADFHLIALAIPAISVLGVVLGRAAARARGQATAPAAIAPDWRILGGGLAFVAVTLGLGLADIAFAQELIFAATLAIVLLLMRRLLGKLAPAQRRALVGTAVILFVFRAVPLPGAGATWWQIDVLGFDQQFLSVLTLVTTLFALAGMLLLRPFMAAAPILRVVAILAVVEGVMWLPNIGMFYGLHDWTARLTGGVVDARFIAILDTAAESPLSQVAMIPMLAWIARNAPAELKATFFAVMASFVNLALSASSLATKYLNFFFVVTREVRDPVSRAVLVPASYDALGTLLVLVAAIAVAAPLAAIVLVQRLRLRTSE
jgi:hypothetical protein